MIYLNCSESGDENDVIFGRIFRSKFCNQLSFLVKPIIRGEENCLVEIYEFDADQDSGVLENDTEIQIWKDYVKKWLDLDVWPKRYFPVFNTKLDHQWYHDFNKDNTENYIQALADVMQYALDLGIKEANIILR